MRSWLGILLAGALFQSGCTWTSTCTRDGEGADECHDTVAAADPPTGSGSAELSCGEEGNATETWSPEFAGIAECSLVAGTLSLHAGSGACHNVDVTIPDFSGPGTYTITPDQSDGVAIAMFRDTGCQTPAASSTGHSTACGVSSSSCQVVVSGELSLERGGDFDVSIDCQRLLYSGPGAACGVCTPARPIQLSFRGCVWGQ